MPCLKLYAIPWIKKSVGTGFSFWNSQIGPLYKTHDDIATFYQHCVTIKEVKLIWHLCNNTW